MPRDDGPERAPAARAPATIVFRGHDFGWGSAGKLHAILTDLTDQVSPPPRLIGVGTVLGRPLLAKLPVDTWYYRPPTTTQGLRALLHRHRVSAALVVLDAEFASALLAAGCPTVFVDSLPYLWTGNDTIPHNATRYCAQLCESLPRTCWGSLRAIERLTWTEAILSAPAPAHHAGRPAWPCSTSAGSTRRLAATVPTPTPGWWWNRRFARWPRRAFAPWRSAGTSTPTPPGYRAPGAPGSLSASVRAPTRSSWPCWTGLSYW